MSGFDTGTQQMGVYSQSKQFGAIIRGVGPPVPTFGVVGDLYYDTVSSELYCYRSNNSIDPWGNWLYVVPETYRPRLKWFSAMAPTPDLGTDGDYCLLWGGSANYGVQPSIYGPKAAGAWPTNPVSVPVVVNPLYSAVNQRDL